MEAENGDAHSGQPYRQNTGWLFIHTDLQEIFIVCYFIYCSLSLLLDAIPIPILNIMSQQ
jgi:hypothetical protein